MYTLVILRVAMIYSWHLHSGMEATLCLSKQVLLRGALLRAAQNYEWCLPAGGRGLMWNPRNCVKQRLVGMYRCSLQ